MDFFLNLLPFVKKRMQNYFTPSCSQYRTNSGSIITIGPNFFAGNCTPNTGTNPFLPPYDFVCSGKQCINPQTGQIGKNPNDICCNPVINTPRVPQFCQQPSVNDCALYLDRQQGLAPTDSAGHFRNLSICKTTCKRY